MYSKGQENRADNPLGSTFSKNINIHTIWPFSPSNDFLTVFPSKCKGDRKVCLCQPRVIIYTALLELQSTTSTLMSTSQIIGLLVLEKNRFKKSLPYMDKSAILVMLHVIYIQTFIPPSRGIIRLHMKVIEKQ